MSSSARLAFVVILVVNCIIWSQGRYGSIPHSQSLVADGRPSLVKRYLVELGYVNGTYDAFNHGEKSVSSYSETCCMIECSSRVSVSTACIPNGSSVRSRTRVSLSSTQDFLVRAIPQRILLYDTCATTGSLRRSAHMASLLVFDLGNQCI